MKSVPPADPLTDWCGLDCEQSTATKRPDPIIVKNGERMIQSPRQPTPHFRGLRVHGFSLVEVVTALGIVAFVVVALLGLMSSGLDTFNSALDQSVRSQIAQRLVTEVQQSDLEELLKQPETLRYFDQEGTEAEGEQLLQSVYTAVLRVKQETHLPKSNASQNLLTVSVKIAQDPARNPDPFGPESRLNISEHTAFIARAE